MEVIGEVFMVKGASVVTIRPESFDKLRAGLSTDKYVQRVSFMVRQARPESIEGLTTNE